MTVLVFVVAFVCMEPAAALLHRLVMHRGRGWTWHASHHRTGGSTFERNDLFPLVFAIATIAGMALGSVVAALHMLVPAGAGITAYGVAYLVVHDGCVHTRFGALPGVGCRYVTWVRAAHVVHHATGGAPYGFLVPLVPADVKYATTRFARAVPRPRATAGPSTSSSATPLTSSMKRGTPRWR